MKIRTKLWWKDFHGTPACRKMQKALAKEGFHLEAALDENSICTDVHIYKVGDAPDAQN